MATCSALIPTPPFTVQGIEVEVTGDGPVEVGAVEIFVVEFPIVVVAGPGGDNRWGYNGHWRTTTRG